MTAFAPSSRSLAALVGLALLALPACKHRSVDITASVPDDIRDRHPIVLSEAPRSIQIYANGSRLDSRQAEDVAAFAAEYREHGRSQIVAEVPSHDGRSSAGHHGLHAIKQVLARNGVAPSLLHARSYPAGDHTVASPIRLSFAKLQARVANECGQWPDDLGASNARFSATNRTHYNFGCSSRHNLAAHVADPLDLERARPEGRVDTVRRMTAIGKLREGQDPSTTYRDGATRINNTVGN